jgi:exosortase E/protease (VPEID-CTERM system)
MEQPSASTRWGIARLLAVPFVLFCEYELLAVRFDGEVLASSQGPWSALGRVGLAVGLAITIVAGGALLSHGWAAREISRSLTSLGRFDLRWGAVHVVAYLAFFRCSASAFGEHGAPPEHLGAWLVAWLACGSMTAVSLMKFALPDAAGRLARVLVRVMVAGLPLGVVAWVSGVSASENWPRLAHLTLKFVAALLGLVSADVTVNESLQLVGADGFGVEVSAPCSGIQGMALITVFVSAYLFTFRDRFRLARALILVPISIVVAFGANVLRIAALVLVGARLSADVAFGGFHSQAGWLMFCAIALSFLAVVERVGFFKRDGDPVPYVAANPTPAYLMPELTLLAVSLCTGLFAEGVDFLYPVRIVCAVGVLWFFCKHWRALFAAPSWKAVVIGAVVFAIWLHLSPRGPAPLADELRERLTEWSLPSRTAFVFVRMVGAVLVVPVAEELAFRGYLQRRLVAADFANVSFRGVTAVSVVITALCFGALHHAIAAGVIASLAYSGAAYLRGRLVDAVAAHATTNAMIAAWVLIAGRWDLWV